MSEFRHVDYRGRWSVAECDAMVAKGQLVVGGRGYGYSCNPTPEGCQINAEWGVRTVGRRGMGNYGTDVLVGLTPRTRALVRDAKIRALVSAGVRPATAAVAVSMPYGMEMPVARLADEVVEMAASGISIGEGHWAFRQATGIDTGGMSYPRVLAAWAIAQCVAEAALA